MPVIVRLALALLLTPAGGALFVRPTAPAHSGQGNVDAFGLAQAVLAARAAQAGWDVRKQGVAGGRRLCVYASAETHTWIHKAADLAGLGTDAIHWIHGPQAMDLHQPSTRSRSTAS